MLRRDCLWRNSADGPDGDDPALRPNQLLAVSLPHSPLDARRQRAVVDVCARHLLTSHGLRSLTPEDPAYAGRLWRNSAAMAATSASATRPITRAPSGAG